MAVKFIIDSASDVLPEEGQRLGVRVLPLKIIFGQEEYTDCVTLSHEQFYEKLVESDVMPTTCQIPPAEFLAAYEQTADPGDTLIVITLSSKLSGTYQSAVIAAGDFSGKALVIDSETVCIGERLLLQLGLQLAERGMDAEAIVRRLEEEKHKIRVLGLLDTLEYLKKGGRISAATALAGSLLSIKPVVSVENGQVVLAGKARGSKQGNNLLRKMVQDCGGIDFNRPYVLAYTGVSDHLLQKYIADSADLWQDYTDTLPIVTVGCTIGTHVGPGAIAVAFYEK